ncbi:MAG: lysylphosphatidylglycerol synthase transmembrane domain-containing protein [Chitinophagales bacterium]|nr:flippase-like domain-containing protein [Chitinophagales bacterium]MDW8274209.1 lysylphosphatidylglycerol synthase transmembrane domain-containing protein [Chitinophagales bacterium]
MRKKLTAFARLSLSVGLGALLIWIATHRLSSEDLEQMKNAFGRANYKWLALGISFGFISNVIRAYRWKLLLNAIGYHPSFLNTMHSVMIMYLGNLAFPRLGEISRCALLARYENIPIQKSIGTMITERLVDVLTMIAVGIYLFWAEYDLLADFFLSNLKKFFAASVTSSQKYIVLATVLVLSAVGYWLLKRFAHNRLAKIALDKAHGLLEGVKSIFEVRSGWLFLVSSILVWLCYTLMAYICFRALSETTHASFHAALALVFFGGIAFIITQGGIGSYPLAVQTTLALYGVPAVVGYAFGWIVWGLQTLMVIVVGFLSLILIATTNRPKSEK